MIKFSLIMASRERVDLLKQLLASLVETTKNPNEIEVLTVFDADDSQSKLAINGLTESFKQVNPRFYTRPRSEWMHKDYINWICPACRGKYVIVLNDDTKFVNQHWDELAWNKLEAYLEDKPDGIVYGFTDTFSGNPKLSYFPLISKKAIDILGFMLPNERKNWGADHDIYALYTHPLVNRKLDLPEIKIQHVAYHTGLRERDSVSFRIEQIFSKEPHVDIPIATYANRLVASMNVNRPVDSNRVLVVYNICGISGKENYAYYLSSLFSILNQQFADMRVVISSCMTSPNIRAILTEKLGKRVSYNWISDKLPLNVTFNQTVQRCVKEFGPFENYLYVDSGVTFGNDRTVVERLYNRMKDGQYAMVSTQVDTDHGYDYWGIRITPGQDYLMPVGKTANLHCQMFSHSLYEAYNSKILPDIFAHHTSESVYTFMNAAINKKWIIAGDIRLHHESSMDGASSGFLHKHALLFKTPQSIEQICSHGRNYGFGYEEYKGVCIHDHRKFDSEGYALDNRLYGFLRDNVFLADNLFDYECIQHHFVSESRNDSKSIPSPKITCLVVSHNKPKHVREAINSILAQDMDDWQAIVMDSGVLYDEGFFDWVADERIKVYRSEETVEMRTAKAMAPWCFNECFRRNLVKGYLVMYLCDDDIIYPNAFSVFIDYVKANPHAHAMYASQDLVVETEEGDRYTIGERRALVARGTCANGPSLDCQVDYLQFCHTREIMDMMPTKPEYWPEGIPTEKHADGVFMETMAKLVPVYPVDIKISQNRRTPISKYNPAK